MAKTKPEKTFKLGSVTASVFVNSGEQGPFRTATVQRRYKDGEEWKSSNAFTATQLAQAIGVMQKTLDYLLEQEGASSE